MGCCFEVPRAVKRWLGVVAMVATLSGVGVSANASVMFIDDFDFSQALSQTGGNAVGPLSSSVNDASILGGDRTLTLSGVAFQNGTTETVSFEIGGGDATSESGLRSHGDVSLLYDGDLSGLGSSNGLFRVSFGGFDLAAAAFVDVVATLSDGVTTVSKTVTLNASNFNPFDVDFDFNGSGVDLTNLVSAEFEIDTEPGAGANNGGVDYSLLSITTDVVPEPATLAMWSTLALVGLCVARRRKS